LACTIPKSLKASSLPTRSVIADIEFYLKVSIS